MFVFKERTCLSSVGTEGSVQFLRLCSLHETTPHIKSQSFSSSLPSVTVPFFLFSQSAFYKCVLKCSASLPALLWNCTNKQEAPVLQVLCIECFSSWETGKRSAMLLNSAIPSASCKTLQIWSGAKFTKNEKVLVFHTWKSPREFQSDKWALTRFVPVMLEADVYVCHI